MSNECPNNKTSPEVGHDSTASTIHSNLQFNTEELAAFVEAKALENPLIDLQVDTQYTTDFPITSRSYTNQDEENNYMNQIPDYHLSLFESLIDQIHLNYRDTYLRTLVLF